MRNQYLFSSESVSEGHPDKVADRISDEILDAVLTRDPEGRVACEALIGPSLVVVGGEISTSGYEPGELEAAIPELVRQTLSDIGYRDNESGFDVERAEILVRLHRQSPDIAAQVGNEAHALGAGDQGLMFGYATSETPERIGAPLALAHQLMRRHACVRKQGVIDGLGPDAKAQVTFRYEDHEPTGLHTIVLASQHRDGWSLDDLRDRLREEIVQPVVHAAGWDLDDVRVLINHGGRFVQGGPAADTGLTGRKIIVDTYGGACPHGGGAFSGKDPSKVDRSAAYAARWIAKHIIEAELARRVTLQLSYVIGGRSPLSVHIDGHGTSACCDEELELAVREVFDLSPRAIVEDLELARRIYAPLSSTGHFGRADLPCSWETCGRVDELRDQVGLESMESLRRGRAHYARLWVDLELARGVWDLDDLDDENSTRGDQTND
jgi:S-adenosylmethionine synthetase